MTFEKQFVIEKLNYMNDYIKEMESFLKSSDIEILKDMRTLRALERDFQLVVDAMTDINQHFIRELNLPLPDDFQSAFYILGKNGILPKDFSDKIAPIVGLRNKVVHRYETVSNEQFLEDLRNNFSDFKTYEKYILDYSQKQ